MWGHSKVSVSHHTTASIQFNIVIIVVSIVFHNTTSGAKAMAKQESSYSYNQSDNFSWAVYDEKRPTYPPSLWETLFSYHDSNSSRHASALDMGSGSGAVSMALAQHFSHVNLLDVKQNNFDQARPKLEAPAFKASLPHECTFSYLLSSAEVPAVEEASQDMVTMFEAIHWCNPTNVLNQMARALKPGGTASLLYYPVRPIVLDNPKLKEAWDEMFRVRYQTIYDSGEDSLVYKTFMKVALMVDAGLDFVDLDPALWRPGAKRILINCGERGLAALQTREDGKAKRLDSRIRPEREEVERMDGVPGWEKVVGRDWFRQYFATVDGIDPKYRTSFLEKAPKLWENVDERLRDSPETRVLFPVAMILATKA